MDQRLVPKCTCSQHLRLQLCRPLSCKTTETLCSQCRYCLDSENVSEHSVDCSQVHQKTVNSYHLLNVQHSTRCQDQDTLCNTHRTAHLTHHDQLKSHKHLSHTNKFMFSGIVFKLTLILSLISLSSAYKPLPWDLWTIEDTSTTQTAPDHANVFTTTLEIPDLVAVAGHLFSYQISPATTSTIQYQARVAGMNALPQWLYFNHTTAMFVGVPLSSNKGRVYITLEVHVKEEGGSVVVRDTVFSIDVQVLYETKHTASSSQPNSLPIYDVTKPNSFSDQGSDNCQPNYYLGGVPPFPQCSKNRLPVLASLVTIVNFTSLGGGQRAALLSTVSEALGICPSRLFVNTVDWTKREGMELWKQLAESGIVDYLDSSTILSFQLSCSPIDYQNEATVTCLSHLDQYLSEQSMGIRIFRGSERPLVVPYLRWFVSAGSTVLVSSAPATIENHARLRRQMEDVIINQPIEMVVTTTIPNVISSSVAVTSSPEQQSTTGTAITFQSISPTATSSGTSGFSSISTTVTLPRSELPFSSTTSVRASSTGIIASSFALPMTSLSKQSTVTSTASSLSSSLQTDASSIASTSLPFSQSSFFSTSTSTILSSQIIVPPSRVIPTSETSRTFQPTMLSATTTIQTTSTTTIQTTSPTTMTTHSLPFVTSMDGTSIPVLPATSIPIMSMVFSMQSVLTSMPILSESVSPIRSSPASISFSIQSSIEDIFTSTQQPLLTTTVSSLSLSFSPPDSFVPTPTPSFSTSALSLTPTSIPLMTESTSMLLPFETTISSPFIEPTPTLSSTEFIQPSTSSILLPETTALSSEVTQRSISMLMPMSSSELTLSISIFTPFPSPSPEPTETVMSSLPFGSQSDIILPVSSSVLFFSPSPSSISSSIGRPQTSMFITSSDIFFPETSTPGPDITPQLTSISFSSPTSFIPSLEISPTTSTVSMLLPMATSDMTLSMSIFTPPPTLLPSETFTSLILTTELVTETIIFPTLFPTPETSSSSPVPSPSFSEVLSLTETTSIMEIFPTTTPVFMPTLFPTPETTFTSASSPVPSLSFSEVMSLTETTSIMEIFPTTTPAFMPTLFPTPEAMFTSASSPVPSLSFSEVISLTETTSIIDFFPTSTPVFMSTQFPTPEASSSISSATPSQSFPPTLDTSMEFFPTSTLVEISPTPTSLITTPSFSSEVIPVTLTSLIDFFPTSTPAVETLTSVFTSFVPSPSPSPGPESFCEVNNVNCGNGICLDVNDTFECACYPDFTGKNCEEIIDSCNPSPCSVNGTSNCTDGNMTFICTCISGYTGLLCEDEIDSCLSSPCQHTNATCLHLGVGEFMCFCPEGFSGELCETDIDPCSPNPCRTNESCIILDNGNFTCVEIVTSTPVSVESTSFTANLSSSQMFSQSMALNVTTIPSSIVTSMTKQTTSTPSATLLTRSEAVSSSPFTIIETPTTTSPSIDISISSTLETSVEISTNTSTVFRSTLDVEPTSIFTSSATESTMTITTSSSSAMPFTTSMFSPSTNVTTQPPSLPTSTPVPSTAMTTQTTLQSTSVPSPSPVETTLVSPSSTVTLSQLPSMSPSASPVNLSPMLLNPIGTLIVNRGQFFQYSIPEATFYDPETGATSALSLSLLDFRGTPLPNTTWIQLRQGILEGLPLDAELVNEAITEHLFILRAQDSAGSSAHDFITLRVLPLGPFSTFLIVPFENGYEQFNQNLSQKLNLVHRLASSSEPPDSTDVIYVNELQNENTLAVSYKNLSITDLNCAEFYQWVDTIYSNEEYTQRFIAAMAPDFIPTPTPRVEGTCSITSTNIPPTLLNIDDIESASISDRVLLLSTVIPAAAVALCCLLIGLCALCMYRRYRSERKYLTSRTLYCNRRPIILEGEIDLPQHRRRPVILANESALQGAGLLEEDDHHSDSSEDELLCLPPGDQERLLQRPDPPGYRLPPTYAHRLLQDDLYDR